MRYFECMFTTKGGVYTMNAYDMPTDNENEIIEILEKDGWEVLEVYGIKPQ